MKAHTEYARQPSLIVATEKADHFPPKSEAERTYALEAPKEWKVKDAIIA